MAEYPFTFHVEPRDGYVLLTSSGILKNVEDVEQYTDFMLKAAREYGVRRILLDERKLVETGDTLEAYQFSETEAASRVATAGLRIAGVCSQENFELNKAYETFLQNRSFVYKPHLSFDEALEWLLS